jgi:hypothetical protein
MEPDSDDLGARMDRLEESIRRRNAVYDRIEADLKRRSGAPAAPQADTRPQDPTLGVAHDFLAKLPDSVGRVDLEAAIRGVGDVLDAYRAAQRKILAEPGRTPHWQQIEVMRLKQETAAQVRAAAAAVGDRATRYRDTLENAAGGRSRPGPDPQARALARDDIRLRLDRLLGQRPQDRGRGELGTALSGIADQALAQGNTDVLHELGSGFGQALLDRYGDGSFDTQLGGPGIRAAVRSLRTDTENVDADALEQRTEAITKARDAAHLAAIAWLREAGEDPTLERGPGAPSVRVPRSGGSAS